MGILVATCCRHLQGKFAANICCDNLPWLFAVCFVYLSKPFFGLSKSFFLGKQNESKPFLDMSKTFICENLLINSVSSCYYHPSYEPLYLTK